MKIISDYYPKINLKKDFEIIELEYKYGSNIVFVKAEIFINVLESAGDYFTPYSRDVDIDVNILSLDVYDENGDEVKLKEEEYNFLEKNIISDLKSNYN